MTTKRSQIDLNKDNHRKGYGYQPDRIEKRGFQPKAQGARPQPPSGGTSISKPINKHVSK